jgi:hypothetical protein
MQALEGAVQLTVLRGKRAIATEVRSGTPGELEPGRASATDRAACFSVPVDRVSAVREQGDQNDDRNRYAKEQEQY